MKPAYDVVVIGAGPAGSIAARTTAQAGLSTLLIEKRQEIGSPVRCGEAVGRDTVEKFIPLDPKWIAWTRREIGRDPVQVVPVAFCGIWSWQPPH